MTANSQQKDGHVRISNAAKPVVAKSVIGYMVFIGDQLRRDGAVFIKWAPANGVGEMLQQVQFGTPLNMVILHFFAATPADVAEHQGALRQYLCPTDANNWFNRLPQIDAYIEKLRTDNTRDPDEDMDFEMPRGPNVSACKKGQKKPPSKGNKRRAKPRWL